MLVIGEKINIMSKTIGPAMKERDAGPDPARWRCAQVEGGADMLDINLGPATKGGPEMMEWVVGVVQEAVPDTRLCLDTMNPDGDGGRAEGLQAAADHQLDVRRARAPRDVPAARQARTRPRSSACA